MSYLIACSLELKTRVGRTPTIPIIDYYSRSEANPVVVGLANVVTLKRIIKNTRRCETPNAQLSCVCVINERSFCQWFRCLKYRVFICVTSPHQEHLLHQQNRIQNHSADRKRNAVWLAIFVCNESEAARREIHSTETTNVLFLEREVTLR